MWTSWGHFSKSWVSWEKYWGMKRRLVTFVHKVWSYLLQFCGCVSLRDSSLPTQLAHPYTAMLSLPTSLYLVIPPWCFLTREAMSSLWRPTTRSLPHLEISCSQNHKYNTIFFFPLFFDLFICMLIFYFSILMLTTPSEKDSKYNTCSCVLTTTFSSVPVQNKDKRWDTEASRAVAGGSGWGHD